MKKRFLPLPIILAAAIALSACTTAESKAKEMLEAVSMKYGEPFGLLSIDKLDPDADTLHTVMFGVRDKVVFEAVRDEKTKEVSDRYVQAYFEQDLNSLYESWLSEEGVEARSALQFKGEDGTVGGKDDFHYGMVRWMGKASPKYAEGSIMAVIPDGGGLGERLCKAVETASAKSDLPARITFIIVTDEVFDEYELAMATRPGFGEGHMDVWNETILVIKYVFENGKGDIGPSEIDAKLKEQGGGESR